MKYKVTSEFIERTGLIKYTNLVGNRINCDCFTECPDTLIHIVFPDLINTSLYDRVFLSKSLEVIF